LYVVHWMKGILNGENASERTRNRTIVYKIVTLQKEEGKV
jgi:hypothetical protein